jgi:hypothetical protein
VINKDENVIGKISKVFGRLPTGVSVGFLNEEHSIVSINFESSVGITFEILEKLSIALETKKIFVDYEEGRCYSGGTFEGSTFSIVIELNKGNI